MLTNSELELYVDVMHMSTQCYLYMQGIELGIDGLKQLFPALCKHPQLRSLDISCMFSSPSATTYSLMSDNKLGDDGAKLIAEFVQHSRTLQRIRLFSMYH